MSVIRILILDDDEDMLDMLGDIFLPVYSVSRADCVKEAMTILSSEAIDLIISDVMMPEVDGIDFCQLIKSNIEYSHIPIILLTAKDTLEAKIEGLKIGADAYIEKPFSKKHLLVQVENLIANRRLVKHSFIKNPASYLKSLAMSEADDHFFQEISDIISANMADPRLSVDFLANTINLSRMTLYRKIIASTDMTPSELISIMRLKKAALLISENRYKLFEVALMVGYSDQSSFSRSFQKQYGLSPRTYMKTILGDMPD